LKFLLANLPVPEARCSFVNALILKKCFSERRLCCLRRPA